MCVHCTVCAFFSGTLIDISSLRSFEAAAAVESNRFMLTDLSIVSTAPCGCLTLANSGAAMQLPTWQYWNCDSRDRDNTIVCCATNSPRYTTLHSLRSVRNSTNSIKMSVNTVAHNGRTTHSHQHPHRHTLLANGTQQKKTKKVVINHRKWLSTFDDSMLPNTYHTRNLLLSAYTDTCDFYVVAAVSCEWAGSGLFERVSASVSVHACAYVCQYTISNVLTFPLKLRWAETLKITIK